METTLTIYQRIAKSRFDFSQAKIKKSGKNSYAGYDYFELSDILPTCLRICNDNGLCPIISFTNECALMTVYSVNGESIVLTSPMASATLKGCHEIQNLGAVETYQRRYLWFLLFEITEPDMLDATQGKDSKEQSTQSTQSTQDVTQKAKPKQTNVNDTKTGMDSSLAQYAIDIWKKLLAFNGYNAREKADTPSNVKALEESRSFIAPYGLAKINEASKEQLDAINNRLINMEKAKETRETN